MSICHLFRLSWHVETLDGDQEIIAKTCQDLPRPVEAYSGISLNMSRLSRLPCLVKNNESSTNLKREKKSNEKNVVRSFVVEGVADACVVKGEGRLLACVCVWVCVCVRVGVCVCVWKRERKKEKRKEGSIEKWNIVSMWVNVRECVWKRGRVCKCVLEKNNLWEREREQHQRRKNKAKKIQSTWIEISECVKKHNWKKQS